MTILTKKFSEFTNGGDLENNNVTVGLEAGANTQFNNPWTFLPPGNTGDRPPIDPAMFDRLRFNSTFQEYEYYNSGTATWVQLNNTGVISGPFVIYTADPSLPTAFDLGGLSSGLLKQTVSLGVATPANAVLDTDYYGPGMSGYMQAPAGMKDGAGNIIFSNVQVLNAVNYLTFSNNATLNDPIISVGGPAADIGISIRGKGLGVPSFETTASSPAFVFRSGTSRLHTTNFIMANTIASRDVSWQDASGTVAYLADIPAGSPSALTRVDDTNVTVTLGGTPATALLQAVSLTMGWTGTLSVGRGGLGQGATPSTGDIPFGGSGIYTPTQLTAIIDASIGNTQGDILYRNATSWVVLPPGTSGQFLQTQGAAANPAWVTSSTVTPAAMTRVDDTNVTLTLGGTPATALLQAVSLTLGWTGTLAETRGGTGQSTYTTGDILYASAANTLSKLAGNITTTKQYLSQTGSGAASAAPSWAAISGSDITGAALTKTDDTNVTLTLGGTPSTALLRAASLTLGWTGQLGLTRGGTNASLTASNGGIVYSTATALAILAGTATANQVLLSGSSTAPAWSTATYLPTLTANQLVYASATNVMAQLTGANSASLVSTSAGVPVWSSTMTNGQLIIGSTGATPTAATLTAGSGITITNGAGSITIASSTSGMTWTTVSGTSQSAAVNNGYVTNNAGAVTVTLPTTFAVGDAVEVKGLGAGGWVLAAGTATVIRMGSSVTSSAGSLTSANRYDTVKVTGLEANATWSVDYAFSAGLTVA